MQSVLCPTASRVWCVDLRDVVQNHPLGFLKKMLDVFTVKVFISKVCKNIQQLKIT